MNKKLYLVLMVVATLLSASAFVACSESPDTPDTPDTPDPVTPEEPLDEDQLRTEIAQMIITAFPGPRLDITSSIYRDIQANGIGGVILFEYQNNIESPEQLKKLCADLQAAAGGNLLIAIDQEGGRVSRLNSKHGYPDFPSAKYLGQVEDSETQYWADLCASSLSEAGITVNFAPVADVDVNPNSPAIGRIDRSFSADPEVVTRKVGLWVDAHTRRHVVSCLKHFPGHGSATADSHKGTTDVTHTWSEAELLPYKRLIAANAVDMIMVGHLFNSNIDADYPSSLSNKTIQGLLRDQLEYDGVVVTDDLCMGALINNYGYSQILEHAINAGVDMLCVSVAPSPYTADTLVPSTIDIVAGLVKSGKIPTERIHEAYARIQALKAKKK